jgi:hypothetical protein
VVRREESGESAATRNCERSVRCDQPHRPVPYTIGLRYYPQARNHTDVFEVDPEYVNLPRRIVCRLEPASYTTSTMLFLQRHPSFMLSNSTKSAGVPSCRLKSVGSQPMTAFARDETVSCMVASVKGGMAPCQEATCIEQLRILLRSSLIESHSQSCYAERVTASVRRKRVADVVDCNSRI